MPWNSQFCHFRSAFIPLIIISTARQAIGQTLTGLGFLPGSSYSEGLDVSGDGEVAVGRSHSYPVRWSEATGTIERIGGTNGPIGYATGVNETGEVVVGYLLNSENQRRAFRWSQTELTVQELATLGGNRAEATDVSHDGTIVVGYSTLTTSGQYRAVKWTQDAQGVSITNLGTLGGSTYSTAYAISGDGSTIVGNGWRWTPSGGMQSLPFYVQACNRTGTVFAGSTQNAPYKMAKYSVGGQVIMLGGDPACFGADSNDDGSVIVGTETSNPGASNNNPHAVVWSGALGSVVDLNDYLPLYGVDLTGWTLRYANGVSGDGRVVVGTGVDPENRMQAWRAVLPCSAISVIMGDVNGDTRVNGLDISLLTNLMGVNDTGRRNFCAADMNHSGLIDSADVPLFVNSLIDTN